MWPFSSKTAPQPDPPSLLARQESQELELIEIRESQEKIFAAIKRMQGRMLARSKVEEPAQDGAGETIPPGSLPGVAPLDFKAQLRHRANQLRASR